MSLNWEWKDKMGECTYQNGITCNLYRGNALVIAVQEFENDTYRLSWFACDENHMKNMLGLTKGYENVFRDWDIAKLRLDTKYKETAKIVTLIAKSGTPITIELYNGGSEK